MARTYSSGILPPPNGGGVSSPLPCPVRCALVSTLLTIRLAVGASDDLGCPLPTPLLQQSLQKGRVLLIGGCPPPPLGQGVPPSLSPAGLSQGARVSAQPPPPRLRALAVQCGSALPGGAVPPSPLDECGKRTLVGGGYPPLLRPLDALWRSALPGWGVPSSTWLHAGSARCWVGGPPTSSIS